MSKEVSGINPEVLRWARERSGYSIADAAALAGRNAQDISEWELGEKAPTYSQLEKLAYKVYKRPVAVFFFPEPPDEPDLARSFRTLPEFKIRDLSPKTLQWLRDMKARQFALRELAGTNPSERLIFRDLHVDEPNNAGALAHRTREYLGISLSDQKNWPSERKALDVWRKAVEDAGVFVFKGPVKQEEVSGFCLYDDEFPLIFLNNRNALTRQTFTLFHELAHILLHINSVTWLDDYVDVLEGWARRVEVFCNRFAAEFLIPASDFRDEIRNRDINEKTISDLAGLYRVSREVILRRLLDRDLINARYYAKMVEEWKTHAKSGGKGGNYYNNQRVYLGDKFLSLAFRQYYAGRCTENQLADYLGVKIASLPEIEDRLIRGTAD